MDYKDAIESIKNNYPPESYTRLREALYIAITVLEEKIEQENLKVWINDMDNPLEPLKIESALKSEIMILNSRKEHNPDSINVLDYTVIAVLAKSLSESLGEKV